MQIEIIIIYNAKGHSVFLGLSCNLDVYLHIMRVHVYSSVLPLKDCV